MKGKVYIETTIPSYLTARPSRNLVVAAHQEITRVWWDTRRTAFDLYVSEAVLEEAAHGDLEFAERRLRLLKGIPVLALTSAILRLSEVLARHGPLPRKAAGDALHMAIATVYECEYMLTWNCRHLANAEIQRMARAVVRKHAGYELPIICTPEALMGDEANDLEG